MLINLDVIIKILSYNSVAFPHLVPSQNYTFGTPFGFRAFFRPILSENNFGKILLSEYFHNLCLW